MTRKRRALALCLALGCLGAAQPPAAAPAPAVRRPPPGYEDVYANRKRLLIIADISTGNQSAHWAISHAAAVIEQMGRSSGAYVAFIRTDTELITRGEVCGRGDYARGGSRQSCGRNLDYFDAVLFYTNGETNLSPSQRQDLLAYVREGHGFIGVHTATATAYGWPEYGEMIGGYFDNHPWMIADARIIVERPDFPAMRRLRTGMTIRDEHYQMRPAPYSRGTVDVLARLDPASVDLANPGVHRADRDFPVAWIRSYGRGRVFYSGLGHTDASWDDARIRTLFHEGIRWALGYGDAVPRPHPIPGGADARLSPRAARNSGRDR
jgi:type 1 glutamine amidotransferase